MTHKQIEASRERRLWISQVIIPAVTIAGAAMMNPEIRNGVARKVSNVKAKITRKIKIKHNEKD